MSSKSDYKFSHRTGSLLRSRSQCRHATLLPTKEALRDYTENGCVGDYRTGSIDIPISGIERKPQLKLLGVIFSTDPRNWDAHFDSMLKKASSRLYILRVSKHYGYSIAELTVLFDSLICHVYFSIRRRGVGLCF